MEFEFDCILQSQLETLPELAARRDETFDPEKIPLEGFAILERLRERGISVVLLSIPRIGRLEAMSQSLGLWRAGMAQAAAERGIPVWRPSGLWDDPAEFCDVGHFSEAGGASFNAWFVQRLSEELDAP